MMSGKIEASQNSASNTVSALTNKPVSEVYMAQTSLPKTKSFRKSHALEYRCYESAKQRCENPHNERFARYGGRGIRFCFKNFQEFLAAVGPRPSLLHTIDRYPNNDGHYESGNVRWATQSEQSRNRSTNRLVSYRGITQSVVAWAEEIGLNPQTIYHRLKLGYCAECALYPDLVQGKRMICPHGAKRPHTRKQGAAKLNEVAVRVIRFLAKRGVSRRRLMRAYGISRTTIDGMMRRHTWKWVSDAPSEPPQPSGGAER